MSVRHEKNKYYVLCNLFPTEHQGVHTRSEMSVHFRIELEFRNVGFEERGKPEYPEKSLSERSRESTTNSTHIWRRVRESNPGHIGGSRALSLLCHPSSLFSEILETAVLLASGISQHLNQNFWLNGGHRETWRTLVSLRTSEQSSRKSGIVHEVNNQKSIN